MWQVLHSQRAMPPAMTTPIRFPWQFRQNVGAGPSGRSVASRDGGGEGAAGWGVAAPAAAGERSAAALLAPWYWQGCSETSCLQVLPPTLTCPHVMRRRIDPLPRRMHSLMMSSGRHLDRRRVSRITGRSAYYPPRSRVLSMKLEPHDDLRPPDLGVPDERECSEEGKAHHRTITTKDSPTCRASSAP